MATLRNLSTQQTEDRKVQVKVDEKGNYLPKTTMTDGEGNEVEIKTIGFLPEDSKFVTNPEPFDAYDKTLRIRKSELCVKIRHHFSEIFHELAGVFLLYNPNNKPPHGFECMFYFEKNQDKCPSYKIRSIEDLTTEDVRATRNSHVNLFTGVQKMNNIGNKTLFTLNKETRLILSDFMFGGRRAQNNLPSAKEWDPLTNLSDPGLVKSHHVHSIDMNVTNSYYGPVPQYSPIASKIELRVVHLDLLEILKAIYGSTMVVKTVRNEEGKTTNYTGNAMYLAQLMQVLPGLDEDAVINISQFDRDSVTKLTAKEGPSMFVAPNNVRYY